MAITATRASPPMNLDPHTRVSMLEAMIDGHDVEAVYLAMREALRALRAGGRARLLRLTTFPATSGSPTSTRDWPTA